MYNLKIIYRIFNTVDGKSYVGQADYFEHRIHVHFTSLKSGRHSNTRLQSAYNEYGRDAFDFEVIECEIPSDKVDEYERFWIAYFNSYENGYNRSKGGGQYTKKGK